MHLLKVGRWFSLLWAVGITLGALAFYSLAGGQNTPVVVFALSIASVTYGALLGTYILATKFDRVDGRDVITAMLVAVVLMLIVLFAVRVSALLGIEWLAALGRIAWPWYVPMGTMITILVGLISSRVRPSGRVSSGST